MMEWKVGQPLEVFHKAPITREQLLQYAQASHDFNEIHTNDELAKASGLPSVIAHGMLSMAFMGDCVSRNFNAPKYSVEKFRARFRRVTYPGDVLTVEGEIKKVESEKKCVVVLRVRNQNGEITTDGEATIIRHLPQ